VPHAAPAFSSAPARARAAPRRAPLTDLCASRAGAPRRHHGAPDDEHRSCARCTCVDEHIYQRGRTVSPYFSRGPRPRPRSRPAVWPTASVSRERVHAHASVCGFIRRHCSGDGRRTDARSAASAYGLSSVMMHSERALTVHACRSMPETSSTMSVSRSLVLDDSKCVRGPQ
jgi:hypothetical protein